jgi:hypothetical protein
LSTTATVETPRAAVRRSLRYSIYEGILAMPLVYLNLPGNYVLATLLARTLDLGPAAYGALVSIPFWCNFFQLFISPWLARHWPARRIFLVTAWINCASWGLMAGVLWWLWRYGASQAALTLGTALALACFSMSVSGVAWTTFVQSWVPEGVRGVYFAKRNRICQVSNLVFLILTAALFEYVGTGLPVFIWLFLGAFLLRVWSIGLGHATPAQGDPPSRETDLGAQVGVLRRDRPFLLFVAAGAVWGFTANFVNPFYPVYLLRQLERGSGEVGLFFVLQVLFGALAFPGWGKLINRYGSRPVLLCAIGIWGAVNVLWALVTPETGWMPQVLGALAGAANAGVVLGQFNLVLKLVPPGAKAMAIGFNIAITSLATALAPLASGWLLAWCFAQGWAPGPVYRGFFLSLPLLALVTWLVVRRLHEPDTAPLGRVVGAMRNVRTLGAVLGLGFLFTFLFEPAGQTYSRLTRRLGGKRM